MIPTLSRPLLQTRAQDRNRLTTPSARIQQAVRVLDHLGWAKSQRFNITVSHSHRLVWYRVAKAGTRSVFAALRSAGVQLDLEEPYGVVAPRPLTRGYRRAGFVRHPTERFLSAWQSTVLKVNHFGFAPETHEEMRDLATFVEWFAELDLTDCDAHLRLQSALLPEEPLDVLGRMESFDTDLARLLTLIGATGPASVRRNASPRRPPALRPNELQLINDRYQADFDRFGYEVRS